MLSYSADRTYTLDDLRNWDFPGTSLAVLGKPVRHSISPQMHNAALAELAADNPKFENWRYFRFEIDPEELAPALPLFHAKRFAGLNLTVPHKEIAFPAIDAIDPTAQPIGAVNTLLRQDSGYRGYNTDGYGLDQGIRIELSREIAGSDFVLLGAGGAARAAAVKAIQSRCRSLTIINRNQERLSNLIAEITPFAKAAGIEIKAGDAESIGRLPQACLLVNATSLGLKASDPTPISEERIPPGAAFFDMIYNPPKTKLMELVEKRGGKARNGLAMLVHQGAKSLEIWTHQTAPAQTMGDAASAALQLH